MLAVDGEFRGVRYDADDRLCLDGQPLIHVSGPEYRTEIHHYERITASDSTIGTSPAYFRVELPSGRTLIYGNDDGSLDGTVSASGTAEVQAWLLKRIVDPYDNRIDYFYFNDPVTGEHHPLSVTWSSNQTQGTNARYALLFEYETGAPRVTEPVVGTFGPGTYSASRGNAGTACHASLSVRG